MRKPLSLLELGLGESARKGLQHLLEDDAFRSLYCLCKRQDHDEYLNQADCLLLDITHPEVNRVWRMFRAGTRIAGVIVIANGAVSLPPRLQSCAVVLQKPLRAASIAWALRKLARLMRHADKPEAAPEPAPSHAFSGSRLLRAAAWLHGDRLSLEARYASMEEVPSDDQERLQGLSFDPDDYLVGVLRGLFSRGGGIRVLRVPGGWIRMNLDVGTAVLHMEKGVLRTLCETRLSEFDNPPLVGGDELLIDADKQLPRQRIAIESLFWLAALCAARGRFPRCLEITSPFRLARWPDLPKLVDIPHAARISAIWTARELTAFEVAEVLGIHQRHVFSFASAAHLLGLFEAPDERVERATADGGWLARRLAGGSRAFSRVLRVVK